MSVFLTAQSKHGCRQYRLKPNRQAAFPANPVSSVEVNVGAQDRPHSEKVSPPGTFYEYSSRCAQSVRTANKAKVFPMITSLGSTSLLTCTPAAVTFFEHAVKPDCLFRVDRHTGGKTTGRMYVTGQVQT